MYKKVVAAMVVIAVLVLFSGCASSLENTLYYLERLLPEDPYYPEDAFIPLPTRIDDDRIEYQGNIYRREWPVFYFLLDGVIEEYDEYVYLGWTSSPFWYRYHIYADSKENPTFLYFRYNSIYVREDYNYLEDTFLIEGTEETILFGEHLRYSPDADIVLCDNPIFILTSVTNPAIKIDLRFVYAHEKWYACNGSIAYSVSDHLLEILRNNGIIPVENPS